jgi:hypothetical protein
VKEWPDLGQERERIMERREMLGTLGGIALAGLAANALAADHDHHHHGSGAKYQPLIAA